jgi:hypothetical protein
MLGASGCGKSTFLNILAGVLSPTAGRVEIDGENASAWSQRRRDAYRIRHIGFIFQDFKLLEGMTVADNINLLRLEGVDAFLGGLERFAPVPRWGERFGARVFKIARDAQGKRLTYLKVTGGTLKARAPLSGVTEKGEEWTEKVDQIRLYSGAKFTALPQAEAGTVCAVTGLSRTRPGQGLGAEAGQVAPVLEPVLTYELILPRDADPHTVLLRLREQGAARGRHYRPCEHTGARNSQGRSHSMDNYL